MRFIRKRVLEVVFWLITVLIIFLGVYFMGDIEDYYSLPIGITLLLILGAIVIIRFFIIEPIKTLYNIDDSLLKIYSEMPRNKENKE
jgi:hypothetical protein